MTTLQEWVDKYPGDPEALQDALIVECDRLRAEVERLRAALKPFADYLTPDLALCKDDAPFLSWGTATVGDIRKAVSTLEQKADK